MPYLFVHARTALALSSALVVAVVASPAAAQTDAACWNRALERFDRHANPPVRGDSSFFSAVSEKGVVSLLWGTSRSMREFPLSLYEIRADLGGPAPTGCSNQFLNNLNYFVTASQGANSSLLGKYVPGKTYPDPLQKGLYVQYRNGTDGLTAGRAYRYNQWPSPGTAGVAETVATACNNAGGLLLSAACQACVNSNGYWLNPLVSHKEVGPNAGVFSTNFLRFYPPKFVLLLMVYKRLAEGPLLHELRQGNITANSNGNGGYLNQKYLPQSCQGKGRPLNQIFTALDGVTYTTDANPIAEMLLNAGYYNSSGNWTKYFSDNRVKWTAYEPPCPGCVKNFLVLYSDGRGDHANPYCKRDGFGNLPGPCRAENQCNSLGMGAEDDGDEYLDPSYAGLISGVGNRQTPGGTCAMDFADDVARFIANNDMDPNKAGSDVTVFVIGLGSNRHNRMTTLQHVAEQGNGRYLEATDFEKLEAATTEVLQEIIRRATSFSVAAITTVQTRGSTFAFIPRFLPQQGNNWEGRLVRFKLYNEFAAGCTEQDYGTKNVRNPNGDSSCNDIYLRDNDDDFIGENGDGEFMKLDDTAAYQPPPALTPWPMRNPEVPAEPVWEAANELTKRMTKVLAGDSSESRTIFTAIDQDGDGKYETRLDFTVANAAKIAPLLFLSGDGVDGEFCDELAARADKVYADQAECAADVIRFIHGEDVLKQNPENRTEPPPARPLPRPNILGDIFHSSPILVTPPILESLCKLGIANQCVYSLVADNLTPGGADAYSKWRIQHQYREQFLLVGANDGMLHAFNAGNDRTGDDPETPLPEASDNHYFDLGTGRELWAFIPPDLLPKLRRYVLGTRHELFVDGTPMVRDVWVDGIGGGKKNGVKEPEEFRTVAVVGEREGGRSWFALDVTDPQNPEFLWSWPPPGTTLSLAAGESWNDVAPMPPSIGPIALENASGAFSVDGVQAEERYIVALNGGYDPAGLRGRSINLLDVWTGELVYRFAPDNPTVAALAAPLGPVAALPALVDMNEDALFDTLIVGDTRGQLWTLSLRTPGKLDNTGFVTNWFGGRSFQQFKGEALSKPSPFFMVAAATKMDNGHLRAYLGSGDRDQVRDTGGGTCGLYNVNACLRKGCNVRVTYAAHDSGSHYLKGGFRYNAGGTALASDDYAFDGLDWSPASACSDTLDVNYTYEITCGSQTLNSSTTTYCDWGATQPGFDCPVDSGLELNQRLATLDYTANVEHSRFYSIRIFSTDKRAQFTDATGAIDYDGARLTDTNLQDAEVSASSMDDDGWYVRHANSRDERTASASLLLGGCVVWNSLEPTNQEIGCGIIPQDTGRLYKADVTTGGRQCGTNITNVRFMERPAIVPPPMPTPVVAVNPSTGKVAYSGISIEPGAPPLQISVGGGELMGFLHSLEVPLEVHQCRHEGICQ